MVILNLKFRCQNPYFELDVEQDAMRKRLLIKNQLSKLNGFAPFCQFLAFWSNCHWGSPSDRGVFVTEWPNTRLKALGVR